MQLCIEISISFKLTQPLTVSTYNVLLYIVNEKGGKPDRNSHPFLYGLRNPYRDLMSENMPSNCTFMNSATGYVSRADWIGG
jgi:hypothetical protein